MASISYFGVIEEIREVDYVKFSYLCLSANGLISIQEYMLMTLDSL